MAAIRPLQPGRQADRPQHWRFPAVGAEKADRPRARHIGECRRARADRLSRRQFRRQRRHAARARSEEHTSELQSLMRISYAVFCLKKKKTETILTTRTTSIQQKQ